MNGLQRFGKHIDTVYPAAPARRVPVHVSIRKVLVSPAADRSRGTSAAIRSGSLAKTDVRLARVAALQVAIASGNYCIAASDLADCLIQSMQKRTF